MIYRINMMANPVSKLPFLNPVHLVNPVKWSALAGLPSEGFPAGITKSRGWIFLDGAA